MTEVLTPRDFRNYLLLYVLFDNHGCGILEKIFRTHYEEITRLKWEDGSAVAKQFLRSLCGISLGSSFPLNEEILAGTELSKYNLQILASLVLRIKKSFYSSAKFEHVESQKKLVKGLHLVWCKFVRMPGKSVDDKMFEDLWLQVTVILENLGVPFSFKNDQLMPEELCLEGVDELVQVTCTGLATIQSRRKRKLRPHKTSARFLAFYANPGGSPDLHNVYEMKEPFHTKRQENIRSHKLFLLRNHRKVRKNYPSENLNQTVEEKVEKILSLWASQSQHALSQTVFRQRVKNIVDPVVIQRVKLAQWLHKLFQTVIMAAVKDDRLSEIFLSLPKKRDVQDKILYYYNTEGEQALDLTKIGKKIMRGEYRNILSFEEDVEKVLQIFSQAFEDISQDLEIVATADKIRSLIKKTKRQALPNLLLYNKSYCILDEVIRCICGTYTDEVRMIQCSRCFVWQHCHCVGLRSEVTEKSFPTVSSNKRSSNGRHRFTNTIEDNNKKSLSSSAEYFCEKCSGRIVDAEVLDFSVHSDGKEHYLTFVRKDGYMVSKNDTVYVLKTQSKQGKGSVPTDQQKRKKVTNKTGYPLVPSNCVVFRVKDLFVDHEGKKVMGYQYIIPAESPYKAHRFYENELLKSSTMESVKLDCILGQCWVLDSETFCKGRPNGAKEKHVYICDYVVNPQNQKLSLLGKKSEAVCTKPCAFRYFDTRLVIERNFQSDGHPVGGLGGDRTISSTSSVAVSDKTNNLNLLLDKLHKQVNEVKMDSINYAVILGTSEEKIFLGLNVNNTSDMIKETSTKSLKDNVNCIRRSEKKKSVRMDENNTSDMIEETSLESLKDKARCIKRKFVEYHVDAVKRGETFIPGICAAVVSVEDAPYVLPQKTNYLTTGLLSKKLKLDRSDFAGSSRPCFGQSKIGQDLAEPATSERPRQFHSTSYSKILPPPAYCEGFLRSSRKEFDLPYDVWCHGVVFNPKLHVNFL